MSRRCVWLRSSRRMGPEVWQPYIPARAVVASAMGARAPVADFGASGSGVDEIYAALAGRLLALTSMDA